MSLLGSKVIIKGTRERATIIRISYGLGGAKRYGLSIEGPRGFDLFSFPFVTMAKSVESDHYYGADELEFPSQAGPVKPFEEV